MQNSQPTDNSSLPIVKISFIEHNREYTIGIKKFLQMLDADYTDEEILKVVRKILNKQ